MNKFLMLAVLGGVVFLVLYLFRCQFGLSRFFYPAGDDPLCRTTPEVPEWGIPVPAGTIPEYNGPPVPTDPAGLTYLGPQVPLEVDSAWVGDRYCLRLFDYSRPNDQFVVRAEGLRTYFDLFTRDLYEIKDPTRSASDLLGAHSTNLLQEFLFVDNQRSYYTNWATFQPVLDSSNRGAQMALRLIMQARAYLTAWQLIRIPDPSRDLSAESRFQAMVSSGLADFEVEPGNPNTGFPWYQAWNTSYPVDTASWASPWQNSLREAADQLHEWMGVFADNLERIRAANLNPRSWGRDTGRMAETGTPRGPWKVGLRLATAELLVGTLPPFNESPLMRHVLRNPGDLDPVLDRLDTVFRASWGVPYRVVRSSLWPFWWDILTRPGNFLDDIRVPSDARTPDIFRESMLRVLLPPFRIPPEPC